MADEFLLGVVALLGLTVAAFAFYYRRIREVNKEYGKAQTLVSDIISSFSKQIRVQEEKFAGISRKIMTLSSKGERIESKAMSQEEQIGELSVKVAELSTQKQQFPEQFTDMVKKVTEVSNAQQRLQEKIANLESKLTLPELSIESAIPIKQDKALASLTPTELSVLEILANEGDKTAPEIKTRVNLTREHTARLMKKLYEEGYLERTTGKIPFAYRIKEEMSKILKKPEAKT